MGTTARLTTRSSWMEFAEVLRERRDFKTSGALSGNVVHDYGQSLPTGRLVDPWRKSFKVAAHETRLVDYVVWSYDTPIAWHVMGGWVVPDTTYSATTSRHQSKIRTAAHNCGAMWVRDSEDEAFIESFRESE